MKFVYCVRFERDTPAPFLIAAQDIIEAAAALASISTEYGRALSVQEVGPVMIANANQSVKLQ